MKVEMDMIAFIQVAKKELIDILNPIGQGKKLRLEKDISDAFSFAIIKMYKAKLVVHVKELEEA